MRKQSTTQRSPWELIPYQTHCNPLAGTAASEVFPRARALLRAIGRRTKRQPYIRSSYFHKDKIFLTHFWRHLTEKPFPEQIRRLKFLPCAVELLAHSRNEPLTRESAEETGILLHRFAGLTKSKEPFYVQVKEYKRTNRKEFISVFPIKKIPR